jgi:hypothetical protein
MSKQSVAAAVAEVRGYTMSKQSAAEGTDLMCPPLRPGARGGGSKVLNPDL